MSEISNRTYQNSNLFRQDLQSIANQAGWLSSNEDGSITKIGLS
jgi:hypothetical protein